MTYEQDLSDLIAIDGEENWPISSSTSDYIGPSTPVYGIWKATMAGR